jgi:hypothetical protein
MGKEKTCDICHKTFPRPSHLLAHQNKKFPCSKDAKKCKYCGTTFTRRTGLSRHLKEVCLKENDKFYKEKVKKEWDELLKEKKEWDELMEGKINFDKKIKLFKLKYTEDIQNTNQQQTNAIDNNLVIHPHIGSNDNIPDDVKIPDDNNIPDDLEIDEPIEEYIIPDDLEMDEPIEEYIIDYDSITSHISYTQNINYKQDSSDYLEMEIFAEEYVVGYTTNRLPITLLQLMRILKDKI